MKEEYKIFRADCLKWLKEDDKHKFDLTFLDPPFNQGKEYRYFNDSLPDEKYWDFMKEVLSGINKKTNNGGAVYFMQREKNTEFVLKALRETGWTLQNLIIWKKKTSAVPCVNKYGKQYQIIAFASKGEKTKVFNRLRISPPLPAGYKFERENGIYVTDVWDDIRELTAGYFAGDEALKNSDGSRFHKQQSPISLLLRIILSSTNVGDTVFDPFSGTGTTLAVAYQLQRKAIGIEIDPINVEYIKDRLKTIRKQDDIEKYYKHYINTNDLNKIWSSNKKKELPKSENRQPVLF